MSHEWMRVGKRHICPVCHKDSWCLLGIRDVLCMRVQSNRVMRLADGADGWLHPVGTNYAQEVREKRPERPIIDCTAMIKQWYKWTTDRDRSVFAKDIGVSVEATHLMRASFSKQHNAWAFPMRDGSEGVIGIRLRDRSGKKWSVTGSHNGLFIPKCQEFKRLLICEGPTDTMAAITIGYAAIGRPSCSGGIDHIKTFIAKRRVGTVIIMSDLDGPGMIGAKTLGEHLSVPYAILLCPAKDIRSFVNSGGNKAVLDTIINQLIWNQ